MKQDSEVALLKDQGYHRDCHRHQGILDHMLNIERPQTYHQRAGYRITQYILRRNEKLA